MKTKLTLFIVILFSLAATAQKQDISAGDELIKAKNHFYTGTIMQGLGALLIITPSLSGTTDNSTAPVILGGILAFTGFIIQIESFSHIGKAGKIMNQKKIGIAINNYGIGIKYSL